MFFSVNQVKTELRDWPLVIMASWEIPKANGGLLGTELMTRGIQRLIIKFRDSQTSSNLGSSIFGHVESDLGKFLDHFCIRMSMLMIQLTRNCIPQPSTWNKHISGHIQVRKTIVPNF